MHKVCILILNYATYQMTIDLIQKLRNLGFSEDIIVVDNASPNESVTILNESRSLLKFILIKNNRNSGYAQGNNIGIRKAIKLGYSSVLIINNDIIINNLSDIYKMYYLLVSDRKIGCICPRVLDKNHKEIEQYVYRPSPFDWSLGIFKYKRKCREATICRKNFFKIYKPQGCCLLVTTKMMQDIDYFDKRTFLYFEEDILAEKMINKKYLCYCCREAEIVHNHSVTIDTYLNKIKKLKIYLKSMNLYMTQFRNWGIFQRFFCSITKGLSFLI